MDLDGLSLSFESREKLFEVNAAEWRDELRDTRAFLDKFGRHIPDEIWRNAEAMEARLAAV
jgi:GTP-dependent phosphoenolpyruvate carboxykinase